MDFKPRTKKSTIKKYEIRVCSKFSNNAHTFRGKNLHEI